MAGKRYLRALVALTAGAALALTGCNPSSDTEEGSGEEEPFIVARTGDIDGRDPAVATAFQTTQTLDLVYDTLIDTSDEGDLEPALATKWELSEDGKTVVLTLREGVEFHNGSAFTAADAQASLERVLDPEVGSVAASNLINVAAVRADGDTSLVLELKQPDAALLRVLSTTATAILDQDDIESESVGRDVNGTGPYKWGSWDQGQKVVLEANEDYWGDVAQLKTVELRVIPDESSVLSGMKAGSFDLGVVSDPSVAEQVDTEEMQLLSQPTLSYHALMLNGRRSPLSKLPVRQAIACALDREQVVDQAYLGQAEITGPITSPAYDYDPTEGLPCDPPDLDAARDLLADAGYPDGFTLETIVMVGEYATATNVATSVQGQLEEIGVELDLQQQQTNVYVDNWLEANYDAAIALNGGSTDPYLMYGRYYTDGASLAKPAGLTDAGLADLLTQANSTTDEDERQQLFQDLQERLLELSPWVWLQHNQSYYLVGNDVEGFKALSTESLEYLAKASREDSG